MWPEETKKNSASSASSAVERTLSMARISTRLAVAAAGVLLATAAFPSRPSLAQAPAGGTLALTGGRVIDLK